MAAFDDTETVYALEIEATLESPVSATLEDIMAAALATPPVEIRVAD